MIAKSLIFFLFPLNFRLYLPLAHQHNQHCGAVTRSARDSSAVFPPQRISGEKRDCDVSGRHHWLQHLEPSRQQWRRPWPRADRSTSSCSAPRASRASSWWRKSPAAPRRVRAEVRWNGPWPGEAGGGWKKCWSEPRTGCVGAPYRWRSHRHGRALRRQDTLMLPFNLWWFNGGQC